MKKFILILIICSKILEIFSTGKDDTGSSQKAKGKRTWDEDNSEQNSMNPNELPNEFGANPLVGDIYGYDWLMAGQISKKNVLKITCKITLIEELGKFKFIRNFG